MTTRRLFPVSLLGLAVALTAWGCKQEVVIPVYQAVPVSTRDIVVSASAAGAIEPIRTVDVKSKASGEITEVAVETGDAVRVGQRLVQVDPRVPKNGLMQAEADLEVAKAQLENAQSQLRRSDELYKTKSITEQEWETAKLQAANANAQLVRAQRSLEDARISYEDTDVRSPINGVVIQRNIEVGTVISSATNNVGGGTVLLQMANLDTVQVRAMVDETDIGKIQAGMAVTITVDAFPNRPFEGVVLKVEPQATTSQNVTMFPVLVRIPNPDGLLRPGMNAEVEMHVGRADGVLAVPNSALRTTRDVASAANVLGLNQETVDQQLAQAREASQNGGQASLGGTTAADSTPSNVYRTRDGREVTLPEGVTAQQVDGIFAKMRNGGPSALSESDRAVFQKIRSAMGGGFGARSGGGGGRPSGANAAFGGEYIVFVLRNGQPTAVQIRTGLTDLDYSEVRSGLTPQDTILVLPSASLVQSQEEFQNRVNRMGGGAVPGMQRTTTPTPPPGGRGR
ncbi:MAG: efflux RND transporter periplasmic adaptor subunit [Candidatus Palauibacterales bacterium]|nr:efflux RND transporter periplasmic adaptor subunit [Candidatus Palauibacterales bacterium]